jgi:molybdopterin-guanine dinucleotide biosynthesis protein A
MTSRLAICGIVLAGGRSSRFGADKLAAELEGRPLLHHAIAAVAAVASEVIVVAPPGSEPSLPEHPGVPVRVVHDPEPFGGPLVGLGAALAAAGHPVAIVVGGDMPRLVPGVLDLLVRRIAPGAHGSARAAVLEVPDGRLQPLPMALEVAAARDVHARIAPAGARSLRELLRDLEPATVGLADWEALDPGRGTIIDIDRRDDLRASRRVDLQSSRRVDPRS